MPWVQVSTRRSFAGGRDGKGALFCLYGLGEMKVARIGKVGMQHASPEDA